MEHAKVVETGLSNATYDVVLLLQQAAADVVRYEGFAADARAEGDHDLARWFGELADSDRTIVDRAKTELAARLRSVDEQGNGEPA